MRTKPRNRPAFKRDEIALIHATVVRVAYEIDAKEWSALQSLYADHVETDYTSLFGGAVQRQRSDKLIAGWRKLLTAVSTQHLLGPVLIEVSGARAVARCHVRAWHHATIRSGPAEWVVGGHYIFKLLRAADGWKITHMKLIALHQTGNANILQQATAAD